MLAYVYNERSLSSQFCCKGTSVMFQKCYKTVILGLNDEKALAHLACEIGAGAFVGGVGEHRFGVAILDEFAKVHEH